MEHDNAVSQQHAFWLASRPACVIPARHVGHALRPCHAKLHRASYQGVYSALVTIHFSVHKLQERAQLSEQDLLAGVPDRGMHPSMPPANCGKALKADWWPLEGNGRLVSGWRVGTGPVALEGNGMA